MYFGKICRNIFMDLFCEMLDNYIYMCYNHLVLFSKSEIKYRAVEQLVARRAHNPKVVGSSPARATK